MADRVVLLHGFTQTRVSWDRIVAELGSDLEVDAIDLPGHGSGGPVPAGIGAAAAQVGDHGGRAVYVGYSLGGRVALRLALDRPDLVRGLVLLGATAGIDGEADRAARRMADKDLAARLEHDGTAVFLEEWVAQPLFAGLELTAADRAARQANDPAQLATSLRRMGTGTMDPPWWSELPSIVAPTLVVAGEHDRKFVGLGRRLAEGIGANARFVELAGCGHAAHLQEPTEFATLIRTFVDTLPQD